VLVIVDPSAGHIIQRQQFESVCSTRQCDTVPGNDHSGRPNTWAVRRERSPARREARRGAWIRQAGDRRDRAWIDGKAMLNPCVTVDDALIASGAAAIRDVPDGVGVQC